MEFVLWEPIMAKIPLLYDHLYFIMVLGSMKLNDEEIKSRVFILFNNSKYLYILYFFLYNRKKT